MTVASFFLFWGILTESGDREAFIPAGLLAALLIICAVFVREVVLRKARAKYLYIEKQLDLHITKIPNSKNKQKLSLKQNAEIINKIKSKSEAAEVFRDLHEGHWEVFNLCHEYLMLNTNELKTVGIGSPRLAALRRGREIISGLHRKHLLTWARIHTRNYVNKSKNQVKIDDKLDSIQQAVIAIKTALKYYPNDNQLIESAEAIREYGAKIKVSHWIEQAERNAFKGNYNVAQSLYKDALFYLGRENIRNDDRDMIAAKINSAIKALQSKQNEFEFPDKNKN